MKRISTVPEGYKKTLKFIIKLTFTSLFIVYILRKVNIDGIVENLKLILPFYLFTSFALYLFSIFILSIKWWVLIPKFNLKNIILLTFVSIYFSMLIPGQIAGDGIKAYKLGKGKKNALHIGRSVIIDKILGFIVIIVLSLLGLACTEYDLPSALWIGFTAVFVFLLALMLFFLLFKNSIKGITVKLLNFIKNRFGFLSGILTKVLGMFESESEALNIKHLLYNILWGFVYQTVSVGLIMIIANGVNVSLSMLDWFWITGVLSLIILLPVTIGGIGLREGSLIQVFSYLKIAPEKALTISLVGFSFQIIVALIGALINMKTRDKGNN